MSIFTTKVLSSPTIIGRTTVLAINGDSRFARFANLTGTDVLNKILDVKSQIAEKIFTRVDLSARQLAAETWGAGNICFSEQIEMSGPATDSLQGEVVSSAGADKNLEVTQEEITDFGRFCELVELNKKTQPIDDKLTKLGWAGGLVACVSVMTFIILFMSGEKSFWNFTKSYWPLIVSTILGGYVNFSASDMEDGVHEVWVRYREMSRIMKERYAEVDIPEIFREINRDGYHALINAVKYK